MPILSTTSSATLTQSTSAPSSPSTSNTISRANTIGEGVVGGILGLFVLCALFYGYFQWKKRLARKREVLFPKSRNDTENPQAAASEVIEKPSMTQVRVITPVSFVSSHPLTWDPFLMRTFGLL